MKLLHGFAPTAFLLQDLKLTVLLIEDGLFGIEDQAIGRAHKNTSMKNVCDANARYQSASHRRKPTILGRWWTPQCHAAVR